MNIVPHVNWKPPASAVATRTVELDCRVRYQVDGVAADLVFSALSEGLHASGAYSLVHHDRPAVARFASPSVTVSLARVGPTTVAIYVDDLTLLPRLAVTADGEVALPGLTLVLRSERVSAGYVRCRPGGGTTTVDFLVLGRSACDTTRALADAIVASGIGLPIVMRPRSPADAWRVEVASADLLVKCVVSDAALGGLVVAYVTSSRKAGEEQGSGP